MIFALNSVSLGANNLRISNGIVSALDQAWLSIINLVISFAFISYGAKEDYGTYLLLLTPLYLFMGVQNALILSPIATVLPSASIAEKDTVYSTAIAAQVAFAILGALISCIGLAIYLYIVYGTISTGLILGFGLAVAGACAREGVRTIFYSIGNARGALKSDIAYGLGLIFLVGALSYFTLLTSTLALMAMGVSALWTYLFKLSHASRLSINSHVISKFWACGRWALVGVLVTWVNLNAYTLVVGFSLSAAAVADINVARLFLMPVALCGTAWSNLHRPQISAWASKKKFPKIRVLILRSIIFGVGMLCIFTALLTWGYPYLEELLGPSYRGLLPLVLLWSLYFAVGLPRTILMATLMTEPAGYKKLQRVSLIALFISLSGLFLLSGKGAAWVVGVLIAVELVQLVLIAMNAVWWWQPKRNVYE